MITHNEAIPSSATKINLLDPNFELSSSSKATARVRDATPRIALYTVSGTSILIRKYFHSFLNLHACACVSRLGPRRSTVIMGPKI